MPSPIRKPRFKGLNRMVRAKKLISLRSTLAPLRVRVKELKDDIRRIDQAFKEDRVPRNESHEWASDKIQAEIELSKLKDRIRLLTQKK